MAKFTNPKDSAIDSLNEGAEDPDEEPVSRVLPRSVAPVAQAAPAIDIAAIVQAAVTAALAAGNQNSTDLAAAITNGMQQVKNPIHENKVGPGISYANPYGDRDFPRPGLRCKTFYGVMADSREDPSRRVGAAWEMEPSSLTVWEQLALNVLRPCESNVTAMDGAPIHIKVVEISNDATGVAERLLIGFEKSLLSKKDGDKVRRNMIPALTELVYQLTGHDFRPLSKDSLVRDEDTLKWFMAEHKAGRYVTARQAVAA